MLGQHWHNEQNDMGSVLGANIGPTPGIIMIEAVLAHHWQQWWFRTGSHEEPASSPMIRVNQKMAKLMQNLLSMFYVLI